MLGYTARKEKIDFLLLGTVFLLVALGFLTFASISFCTMSQGREFNSYHLIHQALYGLIPGTIFAILIFKLDLENLRKISLPLFLLNIFLLLLVFLPFLGKTAGNAKRWIKLGSISFQPSEFLKLTTILYLAGWLSGKDKRKSMGNLKRFLLFIFLMAVIALLLLLEPDASTLGIILLTSLSLFFLAKTPLWGSLLMFFIGIVFSPLVVKISSYRFNRIIVFLHPEIDPMGIGYQIKQALISVGSGGIFGSGLGLPQKIFLFLPQPFSDSIFAVLAKETGFLGSTFLLILYLIFFWRGIKIGLESSSEFSRLLAFGITFWITIQVFINIGSMTGMFPLSGVPLPFVSYGGSALMTEIIGVGILLKISKQ